MSSTGSFVVEEVAGSAAELHERSWPAPMRRVVWHLMPRRPALVLGSTQRDLLDAVRPTAQAAGFDVAVRRSGGGAVLLDPQATLWVDVLLPAGDPWWVHDVGRSARWLGWTWVSALARVGVRADVHEGAMQCERHGRVACLAGLGPGEVLAGSHKVVGISQRRTRDGARFQCVVPIGASVQADELAALVAPATGIEPADLAAAVRQAAAPVDVTPAELFEAFLRSLSCAAPAPSA